MNAVIYARVSTNNGSQEYDRQINDLTAVASQKGWTVEAVFAEKISGAKRSKRSPLIGRGNLYARRFIGKPMTG